MAGSQLFSRMDDRKHKNVMAKARVRGLREKVVEPLKLRLREARTADCPEAGIDYLIKRVDHWLNIMGTGAHKETPGSLHGALLGAAKCVEKYRERGPGLFMFMRGRDVKLADLVELALAIEGSKASLSMQELIGPIQYAADENYAPFSFIVPPPAAAARGRRCCTRSGCRQEAQPGPRPCTEPA